MKTSDTKLFIYDQGILGVMLANALANDFKVVYYFQHWMSAFPTWQHQYVGKGIPGITRVDSYEDTKKEILIDKGIFMFPDVGDGDKQSELRAMGARVFGAGEGGVLEMNRKLFKKILKERGLAVPEYGVVKGIDALEKILRKEKDLWIKLNPELRGIMETCFHKDWETSRGRFYKLAHDLGPSSVDTEFMWEKPIKGMEPGSDFFLSRGIAFKEGLLGMEEKGDGYICKHMLMDKMPAPLKRINAGMAPVWKKYGISGAISSEIRVGEDKIPYFIDQASRFGNPPGATISVEYKNLSKIVEGIADGAEVKPEWAANYGAEISVDVEGADCQAIPMPLEEKCLERVKLRAACKIGDLFWTVPFKEVGNTIVKVVGLGSTREAAEMDCISRAETFCDKVTGAFFNPSTFENLEEKIKEGKKYGISSNDF